MVVHAGKVSVASNEPLTLFLALQREVNGRLPWELCLLPRPHTPDVGRYVAGTRLLRSAGIASLPIELVESDDIADFATSFASDPRPDVVRGWEMVRRAMSSLAPELRTAIAQYAAPAADAQAYVEGTVLREEQWCVDTLAASLGVPPARQPLPIYLVPFAPFPPGTAFLTGEGGIRAAYVDYRRFFGPSLLESVLILMSWHMLALSDVDSALNRSVGAAADGDDRTVRRLRAIALKLLITMTAAHVAQRFEPGHRGTIATYGLDMQYPRVYAAVRDPWQHYLDGRTSRARALDLINTRLAGVRASWFVEQVDSASLAADFYLLEWLTAQGDRAAAARLAAWQPRLAADVVRHVDLAIGAELAHYDAIPVADMAGPLGEFIERVCDANSLLHWPQWRHGRGPDAYRLAQAAFDGPGADYGGDAWAPIAAMMAQYTDGRLPDRVFIDQCFTLEHNNGCIFDKYFDTWEMHNALDAQARGDLEALGGHASAEVRTLLRHHLAGTPGEPRPEPSPAACEWPALGRVGCGSSAEPAGAAPARPWFRGAIRKPNRREILPLKTVTAVFHTDLGAMALSLDPLSAPMAVSTFVLLARGEVQWRDPATGAPGVGPFYDGTVFHRIVPGYVLQGGDRTRTGRGGPGFRYDEDPNDLRFDQPFRVAMANTGIVTNGSQFFITLTKAPHLDGQYTIIGEIADPASREVAMAISEAGRPQLRIERVEVETA